MADAFVGTWKLVDSKNFDDYMKSIGEQGSGCWAGEALAARPTGGRSAAGLAGTLQARRIPPGQGWGGRGPAGKGLSWSEAGRFPRGEARGSRCARDVEAERCFSGRGVYVPESLDKRVGR